MEPPQEFPGCLLDGRPESVALVPLVITEECGQDLILDLLAGRGYSARDKAHDVGIGVQVHQVVRIGRSELPQHQSVRLKENLHVQSFRPRHATHARSCMRRARASAARSLAWWRLGSLRDYRRACDR